MARRDGSGPQGMGPMTGRRLGNCAGNDGAGYGGGFGAGYGRGRGQGFRHGFGRSQNNMIAPVNTKTPLSIETLTAEIAEIRTQFASLEAQLSELHGKD